MNRTAVILVAVAFAAVAVVAAVNQADDIQQVNPPVNSLNTPVREVHVVNFPDPQTVAGTVDVGNLPPIQDVTGTVAVSNLPTTQTVAGSVAVSNLPAVQQVDP